MKSPLNAILLISFVCLAQGLNAAEKTNVFFVHGANMEFCPVAWESDIGPDYNYHVNASNAFVTARRLAPLVNGASGRKVVIAHSLGTMVVAADTNATYRKSLAFRHVHKAEGITESKRLAADEYLIYRVRTQTNELGQVTRANYGRIGEKFSQYIGLSIKSWFNPNVNDTNLEDARPCAW